MLACRVLAELDERAQCPRALHWRQRVLDLEPNRDSNAIAYARTALLLNRRETARQALAGISEPGQCTRADFHDLAAQIAFADRDLVRAQQHLTDALRLDSTNAVYRHNLQIVQLHSPDSKVVQAAREQLDSVRMNSVHGTAITRALLLEALSVEDLPRANRLALELQAKSDSGFGDRLLHLTVLDLNVHRSLPQSAALADSQRRFRAALAGVETEAGSDPNQISALSGWLRDHGFAEVALPWLESFPEEIRKTTPVRLAETECQLARKNWRELALSLDHSHWGADEHLRHAMLALVYRQRGDGQLGQTEWKRAVRAANDGVHGGAGSRLALVRLAGAWSWEEESEQLLWEMAGTGSDHRWALAVLRHAYELGGDTRALGRVFQAMLKSDPTDSVAQNNLAATSLLLQTNLPAAHELARAAYVGQPTNATVACTYAFSMHLQGRTAEGVQLLSRFPEALTRNPTAAAYYGVLLSAQGAKEEAEKYLALANRAHLLPEERALVDQSKR